MVVKKVDVVANCVLIPMLAKTLFQPVNGKKSINVPSLLLVKDKNPASVVLLQTPNIKSV